MCMFDIAPDKKTDYLYHYTSIENLIMYILPQRMLKLSPSNKTNDPQEISDRFFTMSDDLKLGIENKIFDQFLANQKKFSDTLTHGIKSLCFTQDALQNNAFMPPYRQIVRGFEKPRMWAQYADNQKGACLIINRNNMINEIDKQYYDCFRIYDNITYYNKDSERIVKAYTISTSELSKKSIQEVTNDRMKEYGDVYFFYKHSDWKDENEFRVVLRYPDKPFAYLNIDGVLEGIVLGTRFDNDLLKPIEILLEKFNKKPEIGLLVYANTYGVVPPPKPSYG